MPILVLCVCIPSAVSLSTVENFPLLLSLSSLDFIWCSAIGVIASLYCEPVGFQTEETGQEVLSKGP